MKSVRKRMSGLDWPTFGLIVLCHTLLLGLPLATAVINAWLLLPLLIIGLTLYSSLQHEVIHGHPGRSQRLNDALVFPAWGLSIPYQRFRTMHLQHHQDENLTDPYTDPESYYVSSGRWDSLSPWYRRLLMINSTISGRLLLGPAVQLWCFYKRELITMRRRDAAILRAWLLHALGMLPVISYLLLVPEEVQQFLLVYALASYASLSVLSIRTFAEHQAIQQQGCRSVIIEDRGLLAFLFLNNNFHALHHAHPRMPWYRLPAVYRRRRAAILERNGGYCYTNYRALFTQYWWRAKEPIAHPFLQVDEYAKSEQ